MSRWVRVLVLFGAGAVVALATEVADPGTRWSALALLGGAIAAGDLLELRPPGREALPIAFAYAVVLARSTDVGDGMLVLTVALLASFLLRAEPTSAVGRARVLARRLVACAAALVAYHATLDAMGSVAGRGRLLLALTAGAVAPLVVDELARMARVRSPAIPRAGRTADLALVTSGILMAISDQGVDGHGAMGLWGPAVFTIPLLAAWYSYEHLAEIRRTYDQTIRALGAAPELGGLVLEGHAERVAALSVGIADELGFTRADVENLEMAALLHHLGQVCLDEPELGRPPEPSAVAMSGAEILRSTELLAAAGDIIAAETLPVSGDGVAVSGHILKVASAFDELSGGRDENSGAALELLASAPAYEYDVRVVTALDAVLDRRGALSRRS